MRAISMERSLPLLLLATLVVAVILGGCGQEKKIEPVAVGEMERYHDPGIGFSIEHPAGWVTNAQVGRVRMYNAQDVDKKFIDPTGVGPLGVEISVDLIKTPDPAARIQEIKTGLVSANYEVGQESQVTVASVPATKLPFTANYGGSNIIHGHHVFIPVDSAMYDLTFSGFGGNYEAYAAIFDASLKSFMLPKPKEPGRDETLPSETFSRYVTDYFSFDYPDNFNFSSPARGKNDLVVELRGVRQDCSIRFDVFGAEGLDVDKVFDQNKGTYKNAATKKLTVGGEPAWSLTYSPTATVERSFYFVVRNNKVIRGTFDWYKPQREEYQKAYGQVIASVRFPE
jgi:hypothetical protein